jgi:tRNA (guanine37-N1)-methyltransferase
MQFDIVTLFPDIIHSYISQGVIGRAYKLKNTLDIHVHNIRDYSNNAHHKVDDSPYGGGAGMILQIEPIYRTLTHIVDQNPQTKKHIILTKAGGELFTQNKAIQLSQDYDHLIIICGRYEGIDYRVEQYLVDESISIGQFILTGGELPALAILDAVSRHIPNVLGNAESLQEESWTYTDTPEYPQYSRPAVFTPDHPTLIKDNAPTQWEVPETLLSGNHKEIKSWKEHTRS